MEYSKSREVPEEETVLDEATVSSKNLPKTDCDFIDVKTDDSNDCGSNESHVNRQASSLECESSDASILIEHPAADGQGDGVDNLPLEQMYIKGSMEHLQSCGNNHTGGEMPESIHDNDHSGDVNISECTRVTNLGIEDPDTGVLSKTELHLPGAHSNLSDVEVTVSIVDGDSDSHITVDAQDTNSASESASRYESINQLAHDHKYYKSSSGNDNQSSQNDSMNVEWADFEQECSTEILIISTSPTNENLLTPASIDVTNSSENSGITKKPHNKFLEAQEASASSSDSEPDSSSSSDEESSDEELSSIHQKDESTHTKNRQKQGETLARGELSLDDLPRIEELTISVPPSECEAIGRVFSIVKQLVVVESLPNTPTLDLDSVLFRESGRPLGEIFDVFGPVKNPFYCIRFNNHDEIVDKKIEKGELIYCAPQTDYTRYVFVHRLMMDKGSDASWRHDTEVPAELQDFSDDEAERAAKRPNSQSNGLMDGTRKRKHSAVKTNNANAMGEPWYRTKLDDRRSFGPSEALPRPPVFTPVATYRPSIPSPFSARRPCPPFAVAKGFNYRNAPMAPGPRFSPLPPTPTSPPTQITPPTHSTTSMGPRLNMYTPQPPPQNVTGPFPKSLNFPPPFVPNFPGLPQTPPSFGSSNPLNLSSIPPSPLDKPPPFPIMSQLDTPPPNFTLPPPPRIGYIPRPNIHVPPPRQPPPPRPPPFSQNQYHLY